MSTSYLGNCICGQFKFRLNAEPITLVACHCTNCQRRSGGALQLSLYVYREALEVIAGVASPITTIAENGDAYRNLVCTTCQTRLWSESVKPAVHADLRPGTLERAGEFSPVAHVFTRSALPWFVFPEGVARYEAAPDDPYELVRLWQESRARANNQSTP